MVYHDFIGNTVAEERRMRKFYQNLTHLFTMGAFGALGGIFFCRTSGNYELITISYGVFAFMILFAVICKLRADEYKKC